MASVSNALRIVSALQTEVDENDPKDAILHQTERNNTTIQNLAPMKNVKREKTMKRWISFTSNLLCVNGENKHTFQCTAPNRLPWQSTVEAVAQLQVGGIETRAPTAFVAAGTPAAAPCCREQLAKCISQPAKW